MLVESVSSIGEDIHPADISSEHSKAEVYEEHDGMSVHLGPDTDSSCLTTDIGTWEVNLWKRLSDEQIAQVQGMLQFCCMLRNQIAQNERDIEEIHDQFDSRDSTCQRLQRRTQQAAREVEAARKVEKQKLQELAKWTHKCSQCDTGPGAVSMLREQRDRLEAEHDHLRNTELPHAQQQLNSLRDRLASCQDRAQMDSQVLLLQEKHDQEVKALMAEQREELASVELQQAREMARVEFEHAVETSSLSALHAQDAPGLRAAVEDALERRDTLCSERDAVAEELASRQDENSRLQKQSSAARCTMVELSDKVREAMWNARETLWLQELLEIAEDDSQADLEDDIYELRQTCRQLERECSLGFDAVQKKQAEAERWRWRSCHHLARFSLESKSDPIVLGPPEDAIC